MTPTATALEDAVRTFVGRLLDTMRGVPDDAINTWKPAAATEGSHEMNTFAATAIHTVSAAEFQRAVSRWGFSSVQCKMIFSLIMKRKSIQPSWKLLIQPNSSAVLRSTNSVKI